MKSASFHPPGPVYVSASVYTLLEKRVLKCHEKCLNNLSAYYYVLARERSRRRGRERDGKDQEREREREGTYTLEL